MKKKILPIIISLFMVSGMGTLCFADESTTAPEQTEAAVSDTQPSADLEATLEALIDPNAETAATEAPTETTAAQATTTVNTEAEYAFKTPFTVTVLKDNTAVFSDATCTNYRMVMAGEKLTVVGSDGTYFKLDSGEYIVNFALEFAEDASFEKAPKETEAPSEATTTATVSEETSFNPSGIDLYTEPSETGGEIKAKEPKETDPRFTVFCVACGLGLAIGAVGGFFAGSWWNKRKMNAEHDALYQSIKYGETKEALDKEKELLAKEKKEEKALKQAEAKKKREDMIKSLKEKKASLSEKKAEAERKKKLEKLQKMQAELGIAPAEDPDADPDITEQSEEAVEDRVEEVEIPVSTKKPFQLAHKETVEATKEEPALELPKPETTTYAEKKQEVGVKTQETSMENKTVQDVVEEVPSFTKIEKPVRRKIIRPEDMEYGGKDNGGYDFYWDPNDPKDEPFRIKDGKKVFYPEDPEGKFTDEDGNVVEY